MKDCPNGVLRREVRFIVLYWGNVNFGRKKLCLFIPERASRIYGWSANKRSLSAPVHKDINSELIIHNGAQFTPHFNALYSAREGVWILLHLPSAKCRGDVLDRISAGLSCTWAKMSSLQTGKSLSGVWTKRVIQSLKGWNKRQRYIGFAGHFL